MRLSTAVLTEVIPGIRKHVYHKYTLLRSSGLWQNEAFQKQLKVVDFLLLLL